MQTPSEARLLRALLRQDLLAFLEKTFCSLDPATPYLDNWHLAHLCHQLMRVERGELRRLIINVPPRSMKSIAASVAFPAWVLGRNPAKRLLCISYAEELARKLSVDTRTIMMSSWYRELFPGTRFNTNRPRDLDLVTTQQGNRFAAGMNGAILGRGADIILIDDPIKATDAMSEAERRRVNEAFDNTVRTRLNQKTKGAIVIIMQRLHEDDLVGHVLQSEDWEVVSLPAIATEDRSYPLSDRAGHLHRRRAGDLLHPAREPLEVLETMRRSLGTLTFSAQYQQEPLPLEGNIIKREWLRTYDEAPDRFDLVICSWDTASTLSDKADYSVGTVWGAKGLDFYLLDLVRGRFEVPDLRRKIEDLSIRWAANQTIIEDGDMGRALVQDLRRSSTKVRPILKHVRFDKAARFLAQSARFESGQVYVPGEATWLGAWLSELLAFPNGRHDDQVDSTSQALEHLTRRSVNALGERPRRQRPNSRRRQLP